MADLTQQINEARSHGYSDDDIIGYLGTSHPELAPKIKEATGAGYKSAEILSHLSPEQRVPGNTPGERSQYLRTHPDAAKANREATAMHTQEPEGSMLSRLGSGLISPITGPAREIWQFVTDHDAWVKDHIGNSTNDMLSVPLAPQAGQAASGDVAGAVGSTAGQALLMAAQAKAAGPKLIDEPGAPGAPAAVQSLKRAGRVATDPGVVRAGVEMVPVMGPKALKLYDAVQRAREAVAPAESLTPGQILAQQSGADWAKLSPGDQAILEHVAKAQAQANAAAQPPRPPMGPPQAPPEAAPVVQAPPPPAAGPISQVQQPVAPGTGAPQPAGVLQFHTRTPAMGEQMPAPEVQTSQMASEPTAAQLRGVEKTASNRTAKAQRFAQALHDNGISAADAVKIEAGHLGDSQIQAGMAPRWGNIAQLLGEDAPSSLTMPQIIGELKKLETPANGPVEVPSKRAPGGGMGGMKNYFVDPEAAPVEAPPTYKELRNQARRDLANSPETAARFPRSSEAEYAARELALRPFPEGWPDTKGASVARSKAKLTPKAKTTPTEDFKAQLQDKLNSAPKGSPLEAALKQRIAELDARIAGNAEVVKRGGKVLVSDYLNEQVNYGGEIMARGDMIKDLQSKGTPEQVSAYLGGRDTAAAIKENASAPTKELAKQPTKSAAKSKAPEFTPVSDESVQGLADAFEDAAKSHGYSGTTIQKAHAVLRDPDTLPVDRDFYERAIARHREMKAAAKLKPKK